MLDRGAAVAGEGYGGDGAEEGSGGVPAGGEGSGRGPEGSRRGCLVGADIWPDAQGSDHAPSWVDLDFGGPLPMPPVAPPLSTRYSFTGMGSVHPEETLWNGHLWTVFCGGTL